MTRVTEEEYQEILSRTQRAKATSFNFAPQANKGGLKIDVGKGGGVTVGGKPPARRDALQFADKPLIQIPSCQQMNKTEARFYWEILKPEFLTPTGGMVRPQAEDIKVFYPAPKLPLALKNTYTPDFMLVTPQQTLVVEKEEMGPDELLPQVVFFEVKGGHVWEDAKIKYQMAKQLYPCFRFEAWQYKQKKWTTLNW